MHTDFSLANSKYADFLYEPIGEDARGITISMFSALARLKLDPFRESARLAALPFDLASSAIAGRIGELNVGSWDAAATLQSAARLAKLLPKPGAAADALRAATMRAPTLPRMPASAAAVVQTLLRIALPLAAGIVLLLAVGAMIAERPDSPASGAEPSYGVIPGLNSRQD